MILQPVNKQIILIVPEKTDEMRGGLIIPSSIQEKPSQGIVYKSDDENFNPGEILMYRKYSGFEFEQEDVKYLVIEPGDVLLKLIETPEEKSARENKPEQIKVENEFKYTHNLVLKEK